MTKLARVNDEDITAESFVKQLKLTGRFPQLMEEFMSEKILIHAGRRLGKEPTEEEVQVRADQLRRVMGLHRAVDMNRWLDEMGVSLDEFESFIVEGLIHDNMLDEVVNEEAIESYFQLNRPKFEAIILSHIVVDSEGKAKELAAILEDDPDMFEELAREHSLADTRSDGGYIGRVARGALVTDIEAKVFNAGVGEVTGPFPALDEDLFELFVVNDRKEPELDNATEADIRKSIKEEWLSAQAKELFIEVF